MENLPEELIELIAEHLDKKDLQNLRLLNSRLGTGALRPLFSHLNAAFSIGEDPLIPHFDDEGGVWYPSARHEKRSLYLHGGHLRLIKLVNIASRPHLAKHVKSLALGLSGLLGGEPEECNEVMYHYPVVDHRGCIVEVQDLQLLVHRYLQDLQRAVRFALPRLRNLRAIQTLALYCHIVACYRQYGIYPAVGYSCFEREQLTHVAHTVFNHFSHPMRAGLLHSWTLGLPSMCEVEYYLREPMLQNTMCNVRTLRVVTNDEPGHRLDLTSEDMARAEAGLTHLLKLAKHVSRLQISPGLWNDPCIKLDFDLIVCLPLECLHLNNITEQEAPSERHTAFHMGDEQVDSHGLQDLILIHSTISQERLLQILETNATTLHSITISHLSLTSGTWTEIFNFILSQLHALQSLAMNELYYDESGSSAHLAIYVIDPIILVNNAYDLRSADLAEYGLFENLRTIFAERAATLRSETSFCPISDRERPAFGPEKRPYTLLDKWLGVDPM